MKTVVTFRILNFERDPEFLASQLAIGAATFWRKGEPRIHSRHPHESNGWEYRLEAGSGETVGMVAAKLLERIGGVQNKIVELLGKYDAQISCALYISGDDRPEIQFDSGVVSKAAALGASIDVDVYVSA